MNIKDMIICHTGYACVEVEYKTGAIKKVIITEKELHFTHADGRISVFKLPRMRDWSVPYQEQFGIICTPDGKKFYLQDWKAGLFCFDMKTSELLWHYRQKHAYNLVLCGDQLVCEFMEVGIETLNCHTGEKLKRVPHGEGAHFVSINDEYYFCGPKRNSYYILNSELETVGKIPCSMVNPDDLDTCVVRQADFSEDGIILEGFRSMYEHEHPKKPYDTVSFTKLIRNKLLNDTLRNIIAEL